MSRTSKTPLSIYLGYLGWKATNVPLVKGIEPPKQLFEIDAAKIVGLTIDAQRLAEIRSERIALMGGDRRYADLNEIYEDLEHAAAIHRRLGCPVIDVSELSIEEIALRIVRAVERRRNGAPAGGKRPREAEAAGPGLALGRLVLAARRRARRLLRALHAVLVRAASARLARRVPRPPPAGPDALARQADRRRRPPGVVTISAMSPGRFVFDFDEPSDGGRELLGGKGVGLAEMTLMGLPVPAGFTITTDACRAYMAADDLPDGLEAEVAEHVRRLEEKTGKRFGDHDDPLLVSVRSGAADLDAGDDGHDPQPGPERRRGRGARRAHRQPAVRATTRTGG